jgi:hypothetical protein
MEGSFKDIKNEYGVLRCYPDNTFTMFKNYVTLDRLFNDEKKLFSLIIEQGFKINNKQYLSSSDGWLLKIDLH